MFATLLHHRMVQRMKKWGNIIILLTLLMASPIAATKAQNAQYRVHLPIITAPQPVVVDDNNDEDVQIVPGAYYVAPNGSDSNPGTASRPWKTIGKAAATVVAGKTVYVRTGVYKEVVSISRSGTQSQPIKFLAYPGEKPVVEGSNTIPSSYTGLVSVRGDWVTISGFEVRNSKYMGLGLFGQHDTVTNSYVHHSQKEGIQVSGDYGSAISNRSWRNSLQNEYGKSNAWSPGLSASRDQRDGKTEYVILRNNVVWENWGEGVSTYESDHTIIEGNITHDNFSTNLYLSDTTNSIAQRNLVYMTTTSYVFGTGSNVGIMMGDELYKPPSANNKVLNNISFGNRRNFYWWQGNRGGGLVNAVIANNTFYNSAATSGIQINSGTHSNTQFVNNIIQQDGSLPAATLGSGSGVRFSNNLWSKTPSTTALGTNSLVANPQLARTGTPLAVDFYKLTASSPAINKALTLLDIKTDYALQSRGSSPDIGAFEYVAP